MHRFCFISKRSDFEKISKYWKIRNFQKKAYFEKGMHSYVSNVGLTEVRRKRLDLMKNRVSFSI